MAYQFCTFSFGKSFTAIIKAGICSKLLPFMGVIQNFGCFLSTNFIVYIKHPYLGICDDTINGTKCPFEKRNYMFVMQELRTNDSIDSFLPFWLAYTCVGPSVYFQVPEDSVCGMKGIILCVVYSSTLENMGTGCLTSVLIIN